METFLDANSAQEKILAWMVLRFCLTELTTCNEFLHIGVVARDLAEYAAPQEIEPAVPDVRIVCDPRVFIYMQDGRRGAHSLVGGVPRRCIQHLLIGPQDGALQRRRINRLPLVCHIVNGGDHHAARDFPRCMTAEPIGDNIDRRRKNAVAVLVRCPHASDVRRTRNLYHVFTSQNAGQQRQCAGHRLRADTPAPSATHRSDRCDCGCPNPLRYTHSLSDRRIRDDGIQNCP